MASTGLQSWKQEDVFSREPVRRLDICLNTNEAFLGSKQFNPFHFRKFNLEQICFYRNRLPVADSPINTADVKRLYFNTLSDLAYIDNGHGNCLSEYPNHFIMVFDLTSTQQASHDFIHPELTNCSNSIELKFSAALPNDIEIFINGEKASTILIESIGTHWTLFCRRKGTYIFADPLGQTLASYKHLHKRLASSADNIQTVYEFLRYQPIQKPNSFFFWPILYLY